MFKPRLLVAPLLLLTFLASTPADAWRHRMRSTITAEKNNERHRQELQHSFAVPSPNEGATWLCAAYSRNFEHELRNKGNNLVEFEINRFGGSFENEPTTEKISVRATVKDNKLIACAKTKDALDRNDVIIATHSFNKAPRMRSDEKAPEVRVFTAISSDKMNLEDFIPPPPVADDPPDTSDDTPPGNNPPDDNPPPGNNPPNASSNAQAAQILRGCAGSSVGVQFRWQNGRIYGDRRAPGGSVTSVGPYNTFIEVANVAKSRWGCGSGGAVSQADANEMPRLDSWGGAGGGRLLALRFEKTGGTQVYVDAYHSSIGAIHGSAFGSVGAAIRNFCGRSNISC